MAKGTTIHLTDEERQVLQWWSQSGMIEQRLAGRARMLDCKGRPDSAAGNFSSTGRAREIPLGLTLRF